MVVYIADQILQNTCSKNNYKLTQYIHKVGPREDIDKLESTASVPLDETCDKMIRGQNTFNKHLICPYSDCLLRF